jgi:hypothetical protein
MVEALLPVNDGADIEPDGVADAPVKLAEPLKL